MNEEILDVPFKEKESLVLKNLSSSERLKSMLLDHFLMTMTITILAAIPIILSINNEVRDNSLINEFTLSSLEIFFIAGFSSIYLMKDTLNGRSLAKRYLGQIVIDSKTKLPADEIKCILRNLTIPFWPLEVLVVFLSPSKRIGDHIAGTQIMKIDSKTFFETKKELNSYNKLNFITHWLITTICIIGLLWLL